MVFRCNSGSGVQTYEIWKQPQQAINQDRVDLRTLDAGVKEVYFSDAVEYWWSHFTKVVFNFSVLETLGISFQVCRYKM